VGKDRLSEDTLALQKIQQRLGRPDIAITLSNKKAKQVIESSLKDKEFTVKDIGHNPQDPFKTANENNVEIIITGEATAKSAGAVMEGVSMKSYQAEVIFKALNVTDGMILAEASAHAAAAHIEELSGMTAAIKKASKQAAGELTEKMIEGWEDILNNGSNLYVDIKGLTLNNESDFKRFLKDSVRGVTEVHSKGLEDGINSFKVKYLGDSRHFAQALNEAEGDFSLTVTGYKVNLVEAEIKE
jgi:hypothetical protein